MNVILVRHALPERVENSHAPADPGLSPLGREQALRLAEWYLDDSTPAIEHISTSPKLRAVETAAPLAERLGILPEVVEGFSEIDHFSTQYIPVEEMRRENHPQWRRLKNRQWEEAGFFDPHVFRKQVVRAWEAWRPDHDGRTVMVAAHGGTINALLSHFIGLESVFFVEISYTGVCRLRGSGQHMQLLSLNETAHLFTTPGVLAPLRSP